MTSKTDTQTPGIHASQNITIDPFVRRVAGPLTGILNWNELDLLWAQMQQADNPGWYLYTSGEQPPDAPVTEDELETRIESLNAHLRGSHSKAYCGVVYVDSLTEPALIKVFDPESLTSICNIYGKTPLHGWVISRLKPVNLKALEEADADFQRYALGRHLPSVPDIVAGERQYSADVTQTLDARRMGCPLPIINTCRALKSLSADQVLEIVTIEPGAINDIDYICQQTGNDLVACEQASYGYSFFVRKT